MKMSTLVGICIQVFLLSLLLGSTLVRCRRGPSHYKPCPEGLVAFKSKCYRIGARTRGYDDTCTLATVESQEENDFIQGLMEEAGENSLWITGHTWDSKYRNYKGSSYGNCFYMDINGEWVSLYSCSSRRRPVCAILRPCQEEWVGIECHTKCHCYKRTCSRKLKHCYTGCDPGWTGSYCDQELSKPIIENYCLKNKTHYSMLLTMNLKTEYESLKPIDSQGYTINPENFPQKYSGRNAAIELSAVDLSSPFEPRYYEEKIDETTFDWTFRLQKQTKVSMLNDLDFRVRCNFSEADVMDATVTLDLKKELDFGQSSLSPSDISVQIFFTDPFDVKPLEKIALGQPVRLAVTQQATNVSANQLLPAFLSPRKCYAISKDKLAVKQLSDANGCPMVHGIFKRFHLRTNDVIMTYTMTSFGMPGHSSYEISCSLVACYNKGDENCYKDCNYPMNSRQARSVMDIEEPVFMDVRTTVNFT